MGKLLQVDDAEARVIRGQVDAARRRQRVLQVDRQRDQDAYYRRPLGNERDGRSALITSDVHNHVEGEHPLLMRRFMATDHRVSYDGPDPMIAKALKQWARKKINDQGGFRLMSDVLKDGQISRFGVAKTWWRRIWAPEERKVTLGPDEQGCTADQVQALGGNKKYRLISATEITGPTVHVDDPGEPAVGLPPATITVEPDKRYACLVAHCPLKESGPVIESLPPEEFLHEPGKRKMNDRFGCGHIREMSVGEILREQDRLSNPGQPYYLNLDQALAKARSTAAITDTSTLEQERVDRESMHYDPASSSDDGLTGVSSGDLDLRGKRWVIEWCCWTVSGKRLVPAIVTLIGETIVRAEQNEDGIIPYSGWSPIPYPHTLIGGGTAQLHAEDQEAHTLLQRAVLDQAAFSVDQARMVVDGSVDVLGLRELWPGKIIHGRPGSVEVLQTGQVTKELLMAIEMLKGEADERGPSTRLNMGTDAPSFNKTATGISLIQRAAFNKVDLVALAFAELFLVDLYNSLAYLAQNNLDGEEVVLVEGKEVVLSRETLKGDYRAQAEIGLDVDFDDREYGKAVGLLQMAMQVSAMAPMLFPLSKVSQLTRRVFLAAGEPDVGELVADPPPNMEGWFKGIEQFLPQDPSVPPPPQLPPGAGVPPGAPPPQLPPGDAAGGAPAPGRDYVAGQATSQPDEMMMGQ